MDLIPARQLDDSMRLVIKVNSGLRANFFVQVRLNTFVSISEATIFELKKRVNAMTKLIAPGSSSELGS